jgi:hypothetical protein
MFEDILGYGNDEKLIPVDLYDYRVCPRCVNCASTNFMVYDGILSSSITYTEKLICNICGSKWRVTMNRNQKILKVEKKKVS